ncbi:MAG: hypothetical protein KGL39_11645 [Patescibacteria group bacterium]|nr:hypothetical protein [Patescibacteria group bacterium]
MSEFTVDQVVEKYVTLRQIKRDLERDHDEALKPINEKLEKLEIWLLGRMNEDGVENYKTKSGTAYKANKTSCTIADGAVFKEFVFSPVADAIDSVLENAGLKGMKQAIKETLLTSAKWSLVDFRALKKGVEEYIEDNSQVPPGLNVTQTTTVNVRSK